MSELHSKLLESDSPLTVAGLRCFTVPYNVYAIDRAGEAGGAADGAARRAHTPQDESGGAGAQLQVARRAVRARQNQLLGCATVRLYKYEPTHTHAHTHTYIHTHTAAPLALYS